MNKKLFAEYAALKIQEKEIDDKIKELSPLILEEMADHDEVKSEEGVFTKSSRRTWVYPEALAKEIGEVAAKKKEAEQTGTATYEEKFFPVFKAK